MGEKTGSRMFMAGLCALTIVTVALMTSGTSSSVAHGRLGSGVTGLNAGVLGDHEQASSLSVVGAMDEVLGVVAIGEQHSHGDLSDGGERMSVTAGQRSEVPYATSIPRTLADAWAISATSVLARGLGPALLVTGPTTAPPSSPQAVAVADLRPSTPTAVPPTVVPSTVVPSTVVPPTVVPPTVVPPTVVPPTVVPSTVVPPTVVPSTAVPATVTLVSAPTLTPVPVVPTAPASPQPSPTVTPVPAVPRALPTPTLVPATAATGQRITEVSVEVDAPSPEPPAPVRSQADASVPSYIARGEAALSRIPYSLGSIGYTISFHPGRGDVKGLTHHNRNHIEVFISPTMSNNELLNVIAHEMGHAVDLILTSYADRDAWYAARGIPPTTPWWPVGIVADFATPAGDFAECFAYWAIGSPSRSAFGSCAGTTQLMGHMVRG